MLAAAQNGAQPQPNPADHIVNLPEKPHVRMEQQLDGTAALTACGLCMQGVSGFLKKADVAADAKPKAGALLDVVIASAADKRLVTVTAARDAVAAAVLKDDAATELGGSFGRHAKQQERSPGVPHTLCRLAAKHRPSMRRTQSPDGQCAAAGLRMLNSQLPLLHLTKPQLCLQAACCPGRWSMRG
jgi:hypothetical protein